MDDALYTEDLDLASVTTYRDLAALLQTVHLRADKPSLRMLEARTRHGEAPLSKTVVAEMLKGVRFPRKAVVVSFLRACGVRDDQMAHGCAYGSVSLIMNMPRLDVIRLALSVLTGTLIGRCESLHVP